jgi:hypothetical protein
MHHDLKARQPGLGRNELFDELQKLNVRHIVVLSDCCSATIRGVFGKEAPLPKASWPVLDCLFFHHKGVTDINACQQDAFSWFHSNGEEEQEAEAGGAFTLALGPLFCTQKENFATVFRTEDGFVTWQQFAKPLQEGTNNRYVAIRADFLNYPSEKLSNGEKVNQKRARSQSEQVPDLISLAKRAPQNVQAPKWLFGAQLGTAKLESGKTVVVVGQVSPKTLTGEPTPAARADVRTDDIILEVNGFATPTDLDAAREIDHSEQKMTVKIRRGKGTPKEIRVELLPVKKTK